MEVSIAAMDEDDRVLWMRFVSGAHTYDLHGYMRWDRWDALHYDEAWLDVHYPMEGSLGTDDWTVCFREMHPVVSNKHSLGVVIITLLRNHWLPTLKPL